MLGVEFSLIYAIWVIKTIILLEKWEIMEKSKLAIEATCAMKLCAFNQTTDSLSGNISVIAQIVVIHSPMCIVEDTHPKPPPKQVMKVKFWVLTMKTRTDVENSVFRPVPFFVRFFSRNPRCRPVSGNIGLDTNKDEALLLRHGMFIIVASALF